jgi:hypothetical protein
MFGGLLDTSQKRSAGGGVILAGARNGLNIVADGSDNYVELGGALIQDTQIDLDTWYLELLNGAGSYVRFGALGVSEPIFVNYDLPNANGLPIASFGAFAGVLLTHLLFTLSDDGAAEAEYQVSNGSSGVTLGISGANNINPHLAYLRTQGGVEDLQIDIRDQATIFYILIDSKLTERREYDVATKLVAVSPGSVLGFEMYADQALTALRGYCSLNINTGQFKIGGGMGGYYPAFFANNTELGRIDVTGAPGDEFWRFETAIQTSDPGGGRGKWKLGQLTAGAVALDATQYIEVDIDGVVYKLLIST